MIRLAFSDHAAAKLKELADAGRIRWGDVRRDLAPLDGAREADYLLKTVVAGSDGPLREIKAGGLRVLGFFDRAHSPMRFVVATVLPEAVKRGSWAELREFADILAEEEAEAERQGA